MTGRVWDDPTPEQVAAVQHLKTLLAAGAVPNRVAKQLQVSREYVRQLAAGTVTRPGSAISKTLLTLRLEDDLLPLPRRSDETYTITCSGCQQQVTYQRGKNPPKTTCGRPRCIAVAVSRAQLGTSRWTDDELLTLLAERTRGQYVSAPSWNATRRQGDPSSEIVERRFGSWRAAAVQAGLRSVPPPSRAYHRTWTRERVVAALARARGDGVASRAGYQRWRLAQPSLSAAPSTTQVLIVFGSWVTAQAAVDAALAAQDRSDDGR